jgi:uncharacterized membrane protein YfcA
MNQQIIELIIGLIGGLFLGITGIAPTGLILIALDYLKLGDYITNLGTIIFLNLFPITIGSVWEFYKTKQINFELGFILLFSIIIGSYLGSKLVVGNKYKLTPRTIKYITSALGFIIFIAFFISAQHEKSNT